MPIQEEPIVGAVYENAEGRSFEVIGFDEDEGSVEIAYEDGAVEQMDIDAWYELEVERVESGNELDDADDEDDAAGYDEDDDYPEEEEDDDLDDEEE